MNAIVKWWNDASTRDQLAIMILGIALAVYILFSYLLDPVVAMRNEQAQKVVAQQAALARVKKLAAEWKNRDTSSGKGTGRGLEKMVESSFSKHGLRVSGFDASGRAGIRINFDNIEYEKLLAWLHDLEIAQGLKMKDVKVTGTNNPGLVTARILIQKN